LGGLVAATLAGCSGTSTPGSSSAPTSTASASTALSGSIVVDAAASLNQIYPKLATAFEAAHPGTKVTFDFGGSDSLAAAIVSGSGVDVFSSASTKTMQPVIDAKLTAATPVNIAKNQLEIVVPKGNPGKITSLKDFGDAKKTVVFCAATVPCGAAAKTVFGLAKVTAKPDSLEQNVTSVLNKVKLGEADAGLVYKTDVLSGGSAVQGIEFSQSSEALQTYPIAPLTGSKNPTLAKAFVEYVVANQQQLQDAGFLAP
jgi:molybdate transport system substrate-binding protein